MCSAIRKETSKGKQMAKGKRQYHGPEVAPSKSDTHIVISDLGRMLFVAREDVNGLIYKLRKETERAPSAELPIAPL